MKLRVVGTVVCICFLLIFGLGVSQAYDIVWSQQPNVTPLQGYAYSSEITNTVELSAVADDFKLDKIDDIAKIRWWGSYWNPNDGTQDYYPFYYSDHWSDPDTNPPSLVSKFQISIWTDKPAGTGMPRWGYPDTLLASKSYELGTQVTEDNPTTINGPGFTQTVFQYEVDVDQAVDFPGLVLQEDQTYWISIQAEEPVINNLIGEATYQWGWQNCIICPPPTPSNNAVQYGYVRGNGDINWWYELPGEGMAFELEIVPEPSSMVILAAGSMVFLSRKHRRKQRDK